MTSNMSQLNLRPISLKECFGAVFNRLKRICGLGPPISPQDHQGASISSSLGSLICPFCHQRAPKLIIHITIRGQFPVLLIRSFSLPCSFPVAFLRAKGPKFSIAPSSTQFLHHVITMMTSNFPSGYQRMPIYHCVIKGPPAWPLIQFNKFPSRYQGVPFIIASSRALISPIASSMGPKFPKYTTYITYEICTD